MYTINPFCKVAALFLMTRVWLMFSVITSRNRYTLISQRGILKFYFCFIIIIIIGTTLSLRKITKTLWIKWYIYSDYKNNHTLMVTKNSRRRSCAISAGKRMRKSWQLIYDNILQSLKISSIELRNIIPPMLRFYKGVAPIWHALPQMNFYRQLDSDVCAMKPIKLTYTCKNSKVYKFVEIEIVAGISTCNRLLQRTILYIQSVKCV